MGKNLKHLIQKILHAVVESMQKSQGKKALPVLQHHTALIYLI